jgi:hypothetical protein
MILNNYIYIRSEICNNDMENANLTMALLEKAKGKPVSDVIPKIDPGMISFRHAVITAKNDDEAYLLGDRHLGPLKPETIGFNDYLIKL